MIEYSPVTGIGDFEDLISRRDSKSLIELILFFNSRFNSTIFDSASFFS